MLGTVLHEGMETHSSKAIRAKIVIRGNTGLHPTAIVPVLGEGVRLRQRAEIWVRHCEVQFVQLLG